MSCHTLKEYTVFVLSLIVGGWDIKEEGRGWKRWTILSFNLRIHIVFAEKTKKMSREKKRRRIVWVQKWKTSKIETSNIKLKR